jgi:hypothetical protein
MEVDMARECEAIERCAYCSGYVPVTYVDIEPADGDAAIRGRVAVCESCFGDGR